MKYLKPEEYAQSIVSNYLGRDDAVFNVKEQELVRAISNGIRHFVIHEKQTIKSAEKSK